MSNFIQVRDELFDPATGKRVGYVDLAGHEQLFDTVALQTMVLGYGILDVRKPVIAVGGDSMTQLAQQLGWQQGLSTAIAGVCQNDPFFMDLNTPAGTGVLTYDHAAKLLSYQAPGDSTPGPAVGVEDGGVFRLLSSSGLWGEATVTPRLLTASGTSNITRSNNAYWRRNEAGWMYVADAFTGAAFDWRVYGIGGNTSADVLARLDQIAAANPSVYIDAVGTNDIGGSGLTGAQSVASRVQIWDYWLARGVPVIAHLIPPRFGAALSDASNYTAARQAALSDANARLIAAAASRPGVVIADCHSGAVDPTTYSVKAGYTTDGLHAAGPLAYVMGRADARILRRMFPQAQALPLVGTGNAYDATLRPYGNKLGSVGAFAGTGGTAGTGVTVGTGLAANWNASRSVGSALVATANKVPATDGGADWQEFVCSGATADGETIRIYPPASTSSMVAGARMRQAVEVVVTGTGCKGIAKDMSITIQGVNSTNIQNSAHLSNVSQGLVTDEPIVLASEPMVWPSSVSSAQMRIMILSQIGGSFTVRLRNAVVADLPA